VREYWIVDPRDQLIEVWQHKDGRYVLLDAYGKDETFTSELIGAVETNAIFVG
jgi:Uma2 family endonuclease